MTKTIKNILASVLIIAVCIFLTFLIFPLQSDNRETICLKNSNPLGNYTRIEKCNGEKIMVHNTKLYNPKVEGEIVSIEVISSDFSGATTSFIILIAITSVCLVFVIGYINIL